MLILSDRNVMVNPKPDEYTRNMSFSQWHRRQGRKELINWNLVSAELSEVSLWLALILNSL